MGSQGFWNPRISRFFVCLSKNYIRLVYCSKEGGWLATLSTPSGSAPWLFIPGRSIFQIDKISYSVQFRPTSFWCKTCGPLLVFPTNWRHFSQLTALEMLFFEGSGNRMARTRTSRSRSTINSAHIWCRRWGSNSGYIGGRQMLSRHRTISAPSPRSTL